MGENMEILERFVKKKSINSPINSLPRERALAGILEIISFNIFLHLCIYMLKFYKIGMV